MTKQTTATNVFLSVHIGEKRGASLADKQSGRSVFYRAEWTTERTCTTLYTSKQCATRDEAIGLARAWFGKQTARLADVTRQPARFALAELQTAACNEASDERADAQAERLDGEASLREATAALTERVLPAFARRDEAYTAILSVVDRELSNFDDTNRLILIDGLIREIGKRKERR